MCYRTSRSFLPNFVSNAGVTAGCCRDGLMLQSSGRDDDEDGGLELSRKHCHVAATARAPHLSSKEEQSPRRQQWQRFGRRCAHPARRGGRRGPRRRLRGHEEGAVSVGRTMLCRFDGPIEKPIECKAAFSLPPPSLCLSLCARPFAKSSRRAREMEIERLACGPSPPRDQAYSWNKQSTREKREHKGRESKSRRRRKQTTLSRPWTDLPSFLSLPPPLFLPPPPKHRQRQLHRPLPSLITAIKTPYLSNGRIDLDSYDALVAAQLSSGVDGLVIGGTTGEGQLMSWDEHVMLIAHTVNAFGGSRHGGRGGGEDGRGLLVVGNTGSNATREALHATEQGFAVGMDCSLQINPYYGKTSAAGLLKHFGAALSEGAHREGGGSPPLRSGVEGSRAGGPREGAERGRRNEREARPRLSLISPLPPFPLSFPVSRLPFPSSRRPGHALQRPGTHGTGHPRRGRAVAGRVAPGFVFG